VVPVGGRTQWDVGGGPDPDAREVHAPLGVVAVEPAEMIVRVRAGTTVGALADALAEVGQQVALDPADSARATVGGVLAVGRSGLRRPRYGPVRDAVLEARFVNAQGRLVRAGAPLVKNVTGFDLCRLVVGSLGTVGILAEVVLRTHPLPRASAWWSGEALPWDLRRRLLRPASILWDGVRTWVLLEGHPADVDAEAAGLPAGFEPVLGPPALPAGRRSLRIAGLRALDPAADGAFVAEVSTGIVHGGGRRRHPAAGPAPAALHERVRLAFDPTGRLNPGRRPW
jgi:glycolate oxidase FAD binding subunit